MLFLHFSKSQIYLSKRKENGTWDTRIIFEHTLLLPFLFFLIFWTRRIDSHSENHHLKGKLLFLVLFLLKNSQIFILSFLFILVRDYLILYIMNMFLVARFLRGFFGWCRNNKSPFFPLFSEHLRSISFEPWLECSMNEIVLFFLRRYSLIWNDTHATRFTFLSGSDAIFVSNWICMVLSVQNVHFWCFQELIGISRS